MSSQKTQLTFTKLNKALSRLEEILKKPMEADRSNIDASIQRFEFTIELFWKLLKRILADLGQEATYPREVLQAAYAGNLIENESAWIRMLEDRNQTSHAYNEELADAIYGRIKTYFPILKTTYLALEERYAEK